MDDSYILYFLCAIVVLIVDYFVAKKFSEIAEMKGHEGSSYFWFTYVLGLIGMLMVIALPNIKPTEATKAVNTPVHREDKEQTIPQVQVDNSKDPNKNNPAVSAEICDGEKICPKCGQTQRADRRVCWSCGQHFDN